MDASIMKKFKDFDAPPTRAIAQKSHLTLVFAKTGKRIELSNEVFDLLGNAEHIKFSFNEKERLLAVLADKNGSAAKSNKSKAIIYNSALVREIIEKFSIDFSNRTSVSFDNYETLDGIENTVVFKLA